MNVKSSDLHLLPLSIYIIRTLPASSHPRKQIQQAIEVTNVFLPSSILHFCKGSAFTALSISSADCMPVLPAGATGEGARHRSCIIHTVNPQMA